MEYIIDFNRFPMNEIRRIVKFISTTIMRKDEGIVTAIEVTNKIPFPFKDFFPMKSIITVEEQLVIIAIPILNRNKTIRATG